MDYIVDIEGKRLVSSFTSTRTTSPETVIFGDEPDVNVRLVESNPGSSAFPWRYVDLTGHSIRVAIGNPGGDPISGTFSLTFDGNTTTDLAAGSTAAQVDTALNALTSITSAGGVTVTSAAVGQYQIAFNSAGARNIITANTDALYPASSAYIYEATAGDVSTKEVQVANIEVDNAAYVELTTDIAAPAATVTTVREGVTDTTSELQRVEISGDPYLGTFAISINGNTSDAISISASITDLTAAIEGITGIGAGNVVVTGSITDFTIQFAASLGNVAEAVVDVANLTGAIGKTGTIDFNTNQFLELLNGAASVNATLEIVKFKTVGSKSETVLQVPITCREDVIANTPVSTTPFPAYAAASHQHVVADITDLASSDITFNTDTNLTGNGWFLDDDTMAANDPQKVASQQSIKAYVDTQVAGVSGIANVVEDTTPQLGGQLDVNGNAIGDGTLELVKFTETPSAVNEITITNAATAGAPQISATGDDANIDLDLQPKGTGNVTLGNYTLDGDQTVGAGQDNYVLTYDNAAGTIGLEAAAPGGLSNIVEDTTPQLGGDLEISAARTFNDTNGNEYLGFEVGGASAANYLAIRNANTAAGPSLKSVGTDTDVDLNLQPKGSGAVNITGVGGLDLKNNKIQTNAKDTITLVGAGGDSHISITCQTSTTNPSIGVVSTNTNQGLTLNAKGTGNIKLGTLEFDADQSIGAGNDNHVLTYDNATGAISLEAATGLANVVEDTTPQLGGMLDVNGNAIGDGTRELLTFVEDASAVSHIEIRNDSGTTPSIRSAGDGGDIDLAFQAKGTSGQIINSSETKINLHSLLFSYVNLVGNGTSTIQWQQGNLRRFTFGAQNETLTFNPPTALSNNVADLVLYVAQDAVGGRTVTWPASVKWPGGTAPTLSTGANAVDIFRFFWDGTNYYGTYDLNFS